jgi:hypothetical protein
MADVRFALAFLAASNGSHRAIAGQGFQCLAAKTQPAPSEDPSPSAFDSTICRLPVDFQNPRDQTRAFGAPIGRPRNIPSQSIAAFICFEADGTLKVPPTAFRT